jgi:hypothetical protein
MRGNDVRPPVPLWLWQVAWSGLALGVLGGALGCVLLLLRKAAATTVFALSLAAYLVLYIGDMTLGVFAAFGFSQVAILTVVVAIAVGLLWVACNRFKAFAG